jgi:hypothetical protein
MAEQSEVAPNPVCRLTMMKKVLFFSVLVWLHSLTPSIRSQESAPAEKIRDISSDQKFAMRILYDAELNRQLIEGEEADEEKIFSEAIKAIELVSLPSKKSPPNLFRLNSSLRGKFIGTSET